MDPTQMLLSQLMTPQLSQLMQQARQAQNPMLFLQQQMGNNPNYQRAMQMLSGKSPEQMQQTVFNLAKEMGFQI